MGLTVVEENHLVALVQLDCLQTTLVQLNVRVAQLAMHAKSLVIDQWLALLDPSGETNKIRLYLLYLRFYSMCIICIYYHLSHNDIIVISFQLCGLQCMFTLSTWSLFHF